MFGFLTGEGYLWEASAIKKKCSYFIYPNPQAPSSESSHLQSLRPMEIQVPLIISLSFKTPGPRPCTPESSLLCLSPGMENTLGKTIQAEDPPDICPSWSLEARSNICCRLLATSNLRLHDSQEVNLNCQHTPLCLPKACNLQQKQQSLHLPLFILQIGQTCFHP